MTRPRAAEFAALLAGRTAVAVRACDTAREAVAGAGIVVTATSSAVPVPEREAAERAVGPERIRAELGEVLAGAATGRATPTEITVFESLGLAIEDLAVAARACAVATPTRGTAVQIGTRVEF